MPKPRVYVETTIPSFYHEVRTEPDIVARREWTRQWWESAPEHYVLVTSPAVLDELAAGASERNEQRLAVVRDYRCWQLSQPLRRLFRRIFGTK